MSEGIFTAAQLNNMTPIEILGCLSEPITTRAVSQIDDSGDFVTRHIPIAGGIALVHGERVVFNTRADAVAAGENRRAELLAIFHARCAQEGWKI